MSLDKGRARLKANIVYTINLLENKTKLSPRLFALSLQTVVALPLMFGVQTGALAAPSTPAVTATLDVCHNQVTGSWRYSGNGCRLRLCRQPVQHCRR